MTVAVIARIAGSCAAIARGVNARWKSALMRSCIGGSIPMNIPCTSSIGMFWSMSRKFCADE